MDSKDNILHFPVRDAQTRKKPDMPASAINDNEARKDVPICQSGDDKRDVGSSYIIKNGRFQVAPLDTDRIELTVILNLSRRR